MHLLFLDESGRIGEDSLFPSAALPFAMATGTGSATVGWHRSGYLKKLLPRFAVHPSTGELEDVGLKRFPEQVRRPRAETKLF